MKSRSCRLPSLDILGPTLTALTAQGFGSDSSSDIRDSLISGHFPVLCREQPISSSAKRTLLYKPMAAMAASSSQSPTLAMSALALMPAPCKPVSDLASEMTEPDVSFMRLSEVSNSPVLECQESDDMPEWEEESDEHEEVEDLRPFRNSFNSWSLHDFEHPPMSPNRLVHEWHVARLEHLGKALPRCHGVLKKVVAESRGESVAKDKDSDSSWSRKCMKTMAAWSSGKIW